MMFKTHAVIGLMVALFLVPSVNSKFIFIGVTFFASLLPDIDIAHSYIGNRWYLKPLQVFVKHRGIIHSFTLCALISLFFAFFLPVLALPFFLGYSIHLFVDSLTPEGIRPFWPFKPEAQGMIKVGGAIEETLFVVFSILDVILIIKFFM